jgi:Chitinase A, N-terminal domain
VNVLYKLMSVCFSRSFYFCLLLIFSFEAQAITLTIAPSVSYDGSFTISWTGGKTYVELYDWTTATAVKIGSYTGPSRSVTITGKPPGQYVYYVNDCAANVGGVQCTRSPAQGATVAPPQSPEPPSSINVAQSGMALVISWPAAARATSYKLWRSTDNATISLANTSYTDSAVVANTAYSYRVRSCNSALCSNDVFSPSVTVVPLPIAPTAAKAIVNQRAILVTWNSSAYAATYQLTRNGAQIANPSSTVYTDLSVINGTSYTYSIKACNAAGCSASSAAPAAAAGNIQAGSAATEKYVYDALRRLNSVKVNDVPKTEYRYDGVGNRTTVTE